MNSHSAETAAESSQFSVRPATLAGITVVTVAMFLVTYFVTHRYEAEQAALARHAFARGEAELNAGHPEKAAADLRTALFYSRDNRQYRLRLAQALAASGQTDEAIAYFRGLWESEPGNGLINLELAKLAAHQHKIPEALRYYHGAIYGAWEENPIASRLQSRLELIHFLLQENSKQQAESELIAAAAVLPENAALYTRVGDLFMKIPDYSRALGQYQLALQVERQDADAMLGAGRAAFELGRYRTAQRYLKDGLAASPGADKGAREMLDTVDTIFNINPFQPRLSLSQRAGRVVSAFQQAGARLQQCAQSSGEHLDTVPPSDPQQPARHAQRRTASQSATASASPATPLQQLYARWLQAKSNVTARNFRRNADLIYPTMDLVFDIEQQTAAKCGTPTGPDMALLLIARNRAGLEQ